jgi:hypothetical protein
MFRPLKGLKSRAKLILVSSVNIAFACFILVLDESAAESKLISNLYYFVLHTHLEFLVSLNHHESIMHLRIE